MKYFQRLTIASACFLMSSTLWADMHSVYVGTSNSKGIYHAFFDDADGTLSNLRCVAELERPGFLSIHPNHKFLYSTTVDVDDPKQGGVAAFEILDDGDLKFLNRQSSMGGGACHLSVDVMGNCVLVANYRGGSVAALKIKNDGSLEPSSSWHQHEGSGENPKRQQGPHAHSIYTSSDNSYAYAPDLGIDEVVIYELECREAQLTPVGSAKIPGGSMGPRHMKFSAGSRFAYVLNELDLSVSVFNRDEEGQLEYIKSVSTLEDGADKTKMSAAEIRIHPGGKHIYTSNRDLADEGRDSISVFVLKDHGARLSRVEVQSLNIAFPRNFNVDPSGQWMLVGGQRSNNIEILPIDQRTGKLGKSKDLVPFEGGPICVEFLY